MCRICLSKRKAIFAPIPIISLLGCALCGVGCGMLWPGTYSLASKKQKNGGVLMFGLLALAGDIGCLSGPSIAGQVSSMFDGNMKSGFAVSIIFPALLVVMVTILIKISKKQ